MTLLDYLSLYAVLCIWGLLFVNAALSVGGLLYCLRERRAPPPPAPREYPMVSVLVPAHNEALVIGRTVTSLLALDYPADRFEIIVVNDNSTDDSEQILQALQRMHPRNRLAVVSTDGVVGGRGKSGALNIGLSLASGSVIAVYDADNTPEPGALRLLVEHLLADDSLGAVIGKFRTRNRNVSLITRFINIETLAYQCMNQAGRWFFFGLCTIPGTNFVVRRKVLEQIGGWDENALSEDTEVSFRIYRMGRRIRFVPLAVTWEQEPQDLAVWFRQRTRWAKGNLYVLRTNFPYVFDRTAGPMRLDVVYYAAVYVLMLSSLVISDVIFALGLLGYAHVRLAGFSTLLWGMAVVLFVLNIMLTLAPEENEFTLSSALLVLLMLFTYSKLWMAVVLYAFFHSAYERAIGRQTRWYKTVRTAETPPLS